MKSTLSTLLAAQALFNTAWSIALPSREVVAPSPALLRPVKRQASVPATPLGPAKFTPKTNVTLEYEGLNATNAFVHAEMKQPSVLLEHIETISDITCSDTGIVLKFSATEDYNTCLSAWPSKNFIMVTNHNGTCDSEHERGIYVVEGYTFDNTTLTLTASSTRVQIRDQLNDAIIDFKHTGTATTKRDLSGTISADLSGSTLIATDPLTIVANEAKFESTINLSGHVHYNFWKFKVDELYIDFDYSSALNLNISSIVNAEYSTDVYNYNPLSVSVSAFSIPGIIDVGPMVDFGLGIEFAASGSVKASVDVVSTIPEATVHLDFLDKTKTVASGWEAQTNVSTDISAQVELQLNPFADLTVALGVNLFSGLLDMSAGVEAKPQIVNAFAVNVDFTYQSSSGVVFTKPSAEQCINGAWFASAFHFNVDAFVTQFYTKSLYEVELPIYKSQCWNFVK
ncbi:isoamyl alcohol [Colletotrichum truncatum]|uniref:Isoamyl alcohol n=1 Tax=Colletotrichum truncatum TaxID=5467 RepID=A0ACC3Z7T1_COLTU|nr:isoamyl alcohol [Colletotrichum truncatum]KAF6782986.1 isoamyl alcohol [Colletotrichum truncatum]